MMCKVRGGGGIGRAKQFSLFKTELHSSETKICMPSCMAENGRCPSKVFIGWMNGHQEMSVHKM